MQWPILDSNGDTLFDAAANAALQSRAKFPSSSLSALYDINSMPPELAKPHAVLDRAVEMCYRAEAFPSENERLGYLFRRYEELTAPRSVTPKPAKKKKVQAEA